MQRRRIMPTTTLDQRLEEQAKRLRDEARGTPPGVERDNLIRQARQAETAAHMQELAKISRTTAAEVNEYRRAHLATTIILRLHADSFAREMTTRLSGPISY